MESAALAAVPVETVGGIRFRLHPSAGIIAPPYPVLSIWETNSFDEQVRRIGPDRDGEAALVLRPGLDVALLRLGPGGADFFMAIASGADLAAAAMQAAGNAPAFSLPETLGMGLAAGAFVGFTLEGVPA
jgi:hypothetical protein